MNLGDFLNLHESFNPKAPKNYLGLFAFEHAYNKMAMERSWPSLNIECHPLGNKSVATPVRLVNNGNSYTLVMYCLKGDGTFFSHSQFLDLGDSSHDVIHLLTQNMIRHVGFKAVGDELTNGKDPTNNIAPKPVIAMGLLYDQLNSLLLNILVPNAKSVNVPQEVVLEIWRAAIKLATAYKQPLSGGKNVRELLTIRDVHGFLSTLLDLLRDRSKKNQNFLVLVEPVKEAFNSIGAVIQRKVTTFPTDTFGAFKKISKPFHGIGGHGTYRRDHFGVSSLEKERINKHVRDNLTTQYPYNNDVVTSELGGLPQIYIEEEVGNLFPWLYEVSIGQRLPLKRLTQKREPFNVDAGRLIKNMSEVPRFGLKAEKMVKDYKNLLMQFAKLYNSALSRFQTIQGFKR